MRFIVQRREHKLDILYHERPLGLGQLGKLLSDMAMDHGPIVAERADCFLAPGVQQFDGALCRSHSLIFKFEERLEISPPTVFAATAVHIHPGQDQQAREPHEGTGGA